MLNNEQLSLKFAIKQASTLAIVSFFISKENSLSFSFVFLCWLYFCTASPFVTPLVFEI